MALGENINKPEQTETDKPLAADSAVDKKKQTKKSETQLDQLNQDVKQGAQLSADSQMLIVFPVGKEEYAISIDMVKEVVATPQVAPIPQAPKHVLGVANVRGNVLTIMDLATRFNLSKQETDERESEHAFVLVIKDEEYQVGIVVHKVPDTLMIEKSAIDKSASMIKSSSGGTDYITGVVRYDKRLIILIDVLTMIANDYTSSY